MKQWTPDPLIPTTYSVRSGVEEKLNLIISAGSFKEKETGMGPTTVCLLFSFGLLAVTSADTLAACRGKPCPEFKTSRVESDYVVRDYNRSVWVEVDTTGAGNKLEYLRAIQAYFQQIGITEANLPIVELRDTAGDETRMRGYLGPCTPAFRPAPPNDTRLCIRHLKAMSFYVKPFVKTDEASWKSTSIWKTQVEALAGKITGSHTDYTAAFYGPVENMVAEIWIHTSSPGGHKHGHRHHEGHNHRDGHHHGDGHGHHHGDGHGRRDRRRRRRGQCPHDIDH